VLPYYRKSQDVTRVAVIGEVDGSQILRGWIHNHTGTTQINGGVLDFAGAANLTTGNIQLNNTVSGVVAMLGVSSNMTRALGSGANQIRLSARRFRASVAAVCDRRCVSLEWFPRSQTAACLFVSANVSEDFG